MHAFNHTQIAVKLKEGHVVIVVFFPLYPHLAKLFIRLFPAPDENYIYQFTTGSQISIDCRVGCPCDGTVADWKIDTPLPTGLKRVEVSARADRLFASSATVGMNGNYICKVSSSVINEKV